MCILGFHMVDSIHYQDLNINITPASDVCNIDIQSWEALARHSKFINPYYEYWNLIPAIKYLGTDRTINIISVFRDNKLVALFPIEICHQKFLSSLKLWQHSHCYDASPLILDGVSFDSIIELILKRLNTQYCQIDLHQDGLLHKKINRFSYAYRRAYIHNTNELKNIELKGKLLRENNRLLRHLKQDYNLDYVEHSDATRGIKEYASLEEHSWKAISGGAINSEKLVKQYYQELAQYGMNKKNFHFQQLKADETIIAMAIRIESQGHFFEVKTSYHNDFKKYAPGKILECKILESLGKIEHKSVDSCTHHANQLINRLWPDKKLFYRSTIFSNKFRSQLLKSVYIIKLIHQRYKYKHHA